MTEVSIGHLATRRAFSTKKFVLKPLLLNIFLRFAMLFVHRSLFMYEGHLVDIKKTTQWQNLPPTDTYLHIFFQVHYLSTDFPHLH